MLARIRASTGYKAFAETTTPGRRNDQKRRPLTGSRYKYIDVPIDVPRLKFHEANAKLEKSSSADATLRPGYRLPLEPKHLPKQQTLAAETTKTIISNRFPFTLCSCFSFGLIALQSQISKVCWGVLFARIGLICDVLFFLRRQATMEQESMSLSDFKDQSMHQQTSLAGPRGVEQSQAAGIGAQEAMELMTGLRANQQVRPQNQQL